VVVPNHCFKKVSPEALFRYLVVSEVLSRERNGDKRSDALRAVCGRQWLTLDGTFRTVGKRTLYRWLEDYEGRAQGDRLGLQALEALEPKVRDKATTSSLVLPPKLLTFVEEQKRKDAKASIPDVIRRARIQGVIEENAKVDRVTVYRAARRMGVPVKRCRRAADRDSRRFAFPHRMDCVLCDGKHFRAGASCKKRMAYFFLDDATRYGLHAIVGTSENADLFLCGLYEMICKHGYFDILYVDRGPGFIALDVAEVVGNFEKLLIHGEKAYPEGHGKIERFNQTALMQLLRLLKGRPDVDPECSALQLRLNHYLSEVYNHSPHEALGGATPWQRFHEDPKALQMPDSVAQLREKFVVFLDRTMSNDHVISIDGTAYEMPFGYRDKVVTVRHQLLEHTYWIVFDGKLVQLHSVDLAANARDRRAQLRQQETQCPQDMLPKSAAELAFERDFRPVVDEHGGLE
jgi:putative transposase